jgi:hypothetical protein
MLSLTMEMGLGLMQEVGHVDFYPNGGEKQPKCTENSLKIVEAFLGIINPSVSLENAMDKLSCAHTSAYRYYIGNYYFKIKKLFIHLILHLNLDSIKNPCKYQDYKVNELSDFTAGKWQCSAKGCNKMGHWASKDKDVKKHYLITQNGDNVSLNTCNKKYFGLKAISNNLSGQRHTQGTFKFTITGTQGVIEKIFELDFYHFLFIKSNDVSYDFGETEKDIGTIINVKVSFIRLGCIPILTCWGYDDRWSFKTLEITRGTEPVVKLCPTTQFIVTDSAAVTFNVC